MAITKITSYAQFQQFVDDTLKANGQYDDVEVSPHKGFWSTLSYNDFVNGTVPRIPGEEVQILVKGNSKESNFIKALRGDEDFPFGRMPPEGPPFTPEQIAAIAEWIDDGCPQ